jgi:hypothetical protein
MDPILTENLIKLGMGIGGGALVFVGISTTVVLIIRLRFPYLEGRTIGSPKNHENFVNLMLKEKEVKELVY